MCVTNYSFTQICETISTLFFYLANWYIFVRKMYLSLPCRSEIISLNNQINFIVMSPYVLSVYQLFSRNNILLL